MRWLSIKGVPGSHDSDEEVSELLPSTPSLPLRSGVISACCRGLGAGGVAAALLLFASDAACQDKPPELLDFTQRLPPQVIYNYGDNETPRSAAMGGALRALGNGTAAVYLNPATMAEARVYHVGALIQGAPQTGRVIGASTIVDSVTGRLAGGVSFAGGIIDGKGLGRSLVDTRVALAYPLSDRIFLGLGGRYIKISQTTLDTPFAHAVRDGKGVINDSSSDKVAGGLYNEKHDGRDSFINALTFDAGLTLKLGDSVYLAAVGQNLTYPNNGLLPTTVGGGIGIGTPSFSIEADGLADLSSWSRPLEPLKAKARLMLGGEYLLADHVPIRLGYAFDQGAKLHTLSAGGGYVGTEFAIEASLKQTLSSPGATTLLLSLEYFFEASGLLNSPSLDAQ
jgi:hypothetical protein